MFLGISVVSTPGFGASTPGTKVLLCSWYSLVTGLMFLPRVWRFLGVPGILWWQDWCFYPGYVYLWWQVVFRLVYDNPVIDRCKTTRLGGHQVVYLSSIVVKRPDLGDTKSCTLSSIGVKRPDFGDTKSCTLSSIIDVKRPDFGDTKSCTLSYLDVICRYDIHVHHISQPKYLWSCVVLCSMYSIYTSDYNKSCCY